MGPKKMTLSEFYADTSLGESWADDDFDINSIAIQVDKPSYNNYNSSGYYNNSYSDGSPPRHNNNYGGPGSYGPGRGGHEINIRNLQPPFIAKLQNLSEITTKKLLKDLFDSRYVSFEKCLLLKDPAPPHPRFSLSHQPEVSNKKCAFMQLQTAQDLQKVLKWNDIYVHRAKVQFSLADFQDFQDVQQYNRDIGFDENEDEKRLEKQFEEEKKVQASRSHLPAKFANVDSHLGNANLGISVKDKMRPAVSLPQTSIFQHREAPSELPQVSKPKPSPFGNARPVDLTADDILKKRTSVDNGKPIESTSQLFHSNSSLDHPAPAPVQPHPKSNPFGAAKPVDVLSKQLELEKNLAQLAINSTTFKTMAAYELEQQRLEAEAKNKEEQKLKQKRKQEMETEKQKQRERVVIDSTSSSTSLKVSNKIDKTKTLAESLGGLNGHSASNSNPSQFKTQKKELTPFSSSSSSSDRAVKPKSVTMLKRPQRKSLTDDATEHSKKPNVDLTKREIDYVKEKDSKLLEDHTATSPELANSSSSSKAESKDKVFDQTKVSSEQSNEKASAGTKFEKRPRIKNDSVRFNKKGSSSISVRYNHSKAEDTEKGLEKGLEKGSEKGSEKGLEKGSENDNNAISIEDVPANSTSTSTKAPRRQRARTKPSKTSKSNDGTINTAMSADVTSLNSKPKESSEKSNITKPKESSEKPSDTKLKESSEKPSDTKPKADAQGPIATGSEGSSETTPPATRGRGGYRGRGSGGRGRGRGGRRRGGMGTDLELTKSMKYVKPGLAPNGEPLKPKDKPAASADT
ncbi:hypothetical protein CANARDRAFT_26586 [[Candida] arabinofermentans NRRL YB-2248]|uniref:RRM domain-containing protein n=1 Tax=[Candida] arabinofermentans NRRL YB-2248 TaxID=983967 RepID=A0A1E4T613_9ASCO|nr:hypothetical protein CANARDRAFT_26586 [[Candida] arabinofermentans NRRL YB-2248]